MQSPGLQTLATRVRQGDAGSAPRLREELQTPLRRIIRRALRPGTPASTLVRWIRIAAQEVAAREGQAVRGDESWFLAHVAQEIGDDVLAGLRGEAPTAQGPLATMAG